jgi:hypothetical protein
MILPILCTCKWFYTFIIYYLCERGDISLIAVYNFSCISVYKRANNGHQLEPKHVAVTKLIRISAVCDWFNTYTCDSLTTMGMSHVTVILKS